MPLILKRSKLKPNISINGLGHRVSKKTFEVPVFLAQTIDTALLAIFTATETYNEWAWNLSWQAGLVAKEFLPLNAGLSSDLTSTPRGAIKALSATHFVVQWYSLDDRCPGKGAHRRSPRGACCGGSFRHPVY